METLLLLIMGNSFPMFVVNIGTIVLVVYAIAIILVEFYIPPRLQVLWKGTTDIHVSEKIPSLIIPIPNKLILITYMICCLSAIIFMP